MLTFLPLMIHTSITLSLYQPEYIIINNSVDFSYLIAVHDSRFHIQLSVKLIVYYTPLAY